MTDVPFAPSRRTLAAAASALALLACSDSLPTVPEREIAYTVLAERPNAAGDAFVLRPTALFFRTNQLSLLESAKAPDQCEDRLYSARSAAVTDTFPNATYLNAGDAVSLSTSAGTAATLVATTDAFGKAYYAPAGNAPVAPFTPGDVVTLTVPGGPAGVPAVFPPVTLSHTTVTPFTFAAVATKSNDPDGLRITWSAPPAPPSGVAPTATGMLVSLRYATVGTGAANHEVFCTLVDDGSFVIPIEAAANWFRSLPNGHETVFTRWRGEVRQLATNRYANTISTLVETQPTP